MKKTLLLLLSLLVATVALGADVTGRFEPGMRYEEPESHAPATTSRMFARTVDKAGSIDLPATGNSGMIIWTIAKNRVATSLKTPTGAMLRPSDAGSLERGLRRFREGDDEVLHVMRTTAARYQLDVAGPATVVVAEPESAVTLTTWTAPLSRQPGEPVTLHAELRDGDAGIGNATITARLVSPGGRPVDAQLVHRGDGVYSAALTDLPSDAGTWQIRFEAGGATATGTRFARTGSGELVSERDAARLGKIQTEVVGDLLRVSLPTDVKIAGAYRLDVLIADQDRNGIAWGEGRRDLTIGATTLSLDIPLADLGGRDPSELFFDVRLLGLDVMGVAGRVTR